MNTSEQPVQIVMVEDDEGHARLIEKNIRRAGVTNSIVAFTNGTEAVRFLFGEDGSGLTNKGRPLLILLDLNLPDMSGFEVLLALRVAKVKTPILILSGLGGLVFTLRPWRESFR